VPLDSLRSGRRRLAAGIVSLLVALLVSAWTVVARQGAAAATQVPATYPRETARVTFAIAGDVIPHQAVVQAAATHAKTDASALRGGWDFLFAAVADVFRAADFGFANLETPVAPRCTRGSKPFQFDAPVNLLQSLTASGIRIVSFANNHVFDQGQAGFRETLTHLRSEGLLFAGAGDTAADALKPAVTAKNGISVGWIGLTRWLNGNRNPSRDTEPHVAFVPYANDTSGAPGLDEAAVLKAIESARTQCDLVIVSIHWGTEYAPAPLQADMDLARKMLEAGASVIVGHHPHVLQTIETYMTKDGRHAVIFYSLGNFLSNQSRNYVQGLTPDRTGELRDSLIATFAVVRKDYGPGGSRVELGDMGILPAWTENNALALRAGRAKVPVIRPVLLDREIPALERRVAELQPLGAQMTSDQKQEFVQVSSQLQMLKRRRELLVARTGDDYVIAPPALAP
jgi:poly-gamma-glutamate synthesis protein (capsule biosynthesis protein)